MPTLTPPSSSATTPVRPSSPTPRMDVDSPAAPLSPAAESGSATPADEQIPVAAQKQPQQLSTPKLSDTENEGEEAPRRKDGILDAEIVDRWNKEFGDVFARS